MALTDLTRISTSGIATGTSLSGAILHGDAHFRGTQVGVTSALFDSSDDALEFNDNVKLKFGNSGDLEIYHQNNVSYIDDTTGNQLRIQANDLRIRKQDSGEEMITAFANGTVNLFHNGDQKLQTDQAGVKVTGILTATGFSGPLSNASGISTFYDLRVTNNLTVEGTTTTLDTNLIGVDRIEVGADSDTIVGVAVTQSGTADIVNLFDGGTNVLTINDTGDVGIGTDNPSQPLHISRSNPVIRLTDTDTSVSSQINATNGNLYFDTTNSNRDVIFRGGSDEVARITGDGKLGIGTNTPSHKIDISGDGVAFPSAAGSTLLRLRSSAGTATLSIDAAAGSFSAIQFGDTAAASVGSILYNHLDDSMKFNTGGTGEKLFIKSDGKVGINTDNPTQMLTSYAESGYPFLANGPSNSVAINNGGVVVFGTKDVAAYAAGALDASQLQFRISGNPRLTIHNSGYVGVNDSTNNARLIVKGNSDNGDADCQIRIYDTDTTVGSQIPSISFWGGSTQMSYIRSTSEGVKFYVGAGGSLTQKLRISNDGDIIVGSFTTVDTRNTGGIHIQPNRGISFRAFGSQSASRNWRIRNDDTVFGNLDFSVGDDNSTDIGSGAADAVLSLASNHNVGINNTTPDQRLKISGNVETNAYDSANGQGGYYTSKGLIIGNAYDAGITGLTDDRNGIIWQERGLDLDFGTNNTFRMKMTYDGKIGIGTDTVHNNARLQVSTNQQVVAMFEGTGVSDPQIYVGDNMASPTDNCIILGYDKADNRGYLTVGGDGDTVFTVANGGAIGMGLNPGASTGRLQVNGGIRVAGNATASDTTSPYIYRTSGTDNLNFATSGAERVQINSTGTTIFKGHSTGTEQVKIQSSGGGTGLFFGNFQGIDAGDASSRLGVGKNDNALIFTNASGSQISNFAIGNTDNIPLVLSTNNKKRFQITGPGIAIFHDNQGSYTNTVQSHSGEAGFITHYTARTTQGSDRYRRMLDIASGGANPHGSSIRFLTSDDSTNPATCVERMRILNNGGVYIGNKTHNLNYPHGESPALLTVQDGARVTTTSGVFAAPKGGFCDQSRYDLERKLINISNSNCGIVQARNGQPLTINESKDSWSYYDNLPNYLLGHASTDNINNSNFTLTLYADMTVFLIRNAGWNGITNTYNFPNDWYKIEDGITVSPSGTSNIWVTTVPRGAYSWDNDSAMYIFIL